MYASDNEICIMSVSHPSLYATGETHPFKGIKGMPHFLIEPNYKEEIILQDSAY